MALDRTSGPQTRKGSLMICSFSHGLCFLELLCSGVLLGFSFGIGATLWRLITSK